MTRKGVMLRLMVLALLAYSSVMKIATLSAQEQANDIIFSGQDAEFSTKVQTSAEFSSVTAKLDWSVHRNGEENSALYKLTQLIDRNVLTALELSIAINNQEESLKLPINSEEIIKRPTTSSLDRIFVNGAEDVRLLGVLSPN